MLHFYYNKAMGHFLRRLNGKWWKRNATVTWGRFLWCLGCWGRLSLWLYWFCSSADEDTPETRAGRQERVTACYLTDPASDTQTHTNTMLDIWHMIAMTSWVWFPGKTLYRSINYTAWTHCTVSRFGKASDKWISIFSESDSKVL